MKKMSTLLFIATTIASTAYSTQNTNDTNAKKQPLFTITNVTEYDDIKKLRDETVDDIKKIKDEAVEQVNETKDDLIKQINETKDDFTQQINTSKDDLIRQFNEALKNKRQDVVITGTSLTAGAVGVACMGAGIHHIAQASKNQNKFTVDAAAGTYLISGFLLTGAGILGITVNDTIVNFLHKK